MAGFDPDQFLAETSPGAAKGFDPDKFLAETAAHTPLPKSDKTSVPEALMRGAAQGATFGFADEASAGVNAVRDYLAAKLGLRGDIDLADAYTTNRDAIRKRDALAKDEHPVANTVGGAAGAMGTAFVPGMAALNAGKGAGLIEMGAKGALQGALSGAGEAESLGDIPDEAIRGAKWGGALGAGLGAAGKVGGAVLDAAKPARVASVMLNVPETAVQRYIDSPAAVNAARPRAKLVEDFLGRLEGLKSDVIDGSQASRRTLEAEGQKMSGSEIADIFDRHAGDIAKRSEGVMDDPSITAAYNWLRDKSKAYRPAIPEGLSDDLAGFLEGVVGAESGHFPEEAFKTAHSVRLPEGMTAQQALAAEADRKLSTNRVKDLVQSLQRQTKYEVAPGQFHDVNDLIRQKVAGEVNGALKSTSPAYASQMEQVAKDSGLLNGVADLAKSPQGFDNLLKRTQRGNTPHIMDSLQQFDKRTGGGLLDELQNSAVKDALDKGYTNGSRAVNAYGEAFAASGEKIAGIPGRLAGKLIGNVTGATVDKYGGPIARGAVDSAAKLKELVSSSEGLQRLGKYAGPLVEAAKRGNQSLAATNFVLQQTDEGYRQKHKELFGSGDAEAQP